VAAGTPLVLAAVLADGGAPARDASLRARFVREAKADVVESAGECALADDGREADAKEGDGVYTCVFVPPAAGRFWAAVEARGTTLSGLPFARNGGVFLLASDAPLEARVDGK
jgi:hypothetical protein